MTQTPFDFAKWNTAIIAAVHFGLWGVFLKHLPRIVAVASSVLIWTESIATFIRMELASSNEDL
jgi:hypothetical protein